MQADTMRYEPSALEAWSTQLLGAVGLEHEAARIVSESLVEANLRGVDSHGVLRLPVYLRRIEAGLVSRSPQPRVLHKSGAVALIDADHAPGQVAGVFAVDLSIELAKEYGVGVAGVRGSAHYGAAAYYVMRAAKQGYIALTVTNVEPDVVPYGGARAELGTNPLAFAAPAPQGLFVLDMATSFVAMGKVLLAREQDHPIPEEWAVDKEGQPTPDPHLAAAVVPLGGPKGYGLALMVEFLAGVFTGAGLTHAVHRMYDEWDVPQDVGHFFLVVDPEKTIGRDRFAELAGELWNTLKSTPPAPGFDEVLIPGELEERTRQRRLGSGIPVPETVYTQLREASEKLGVEVPAAKS